MKTVEQFRVEQVLRDARPSALSRAVDVSSGSRVILKRSGNSDADNESVAKLRRDFEVSKRLSSPYVAKPVDLLSSDDALTLVLEDIEGRPLDAWFADGPVPLATALAWAVQLARAVADIHAAGVVHRAIAPTAILCGAHGAQLKLHDFSAAMTLERDTGDRREALLDTITLAFVAPEQTGHESRVIDYRADYYGLGATLYALFTGRPPFESDDPLSLVHAHLARTPLAPSEVNPEVPAAVSSILLKLLQKDPEDRYQSSRGILSDLERCEREYRELGEVSVFEPAEEDHVERLHISQKLYGRERELARLTEAFQTARSGRATLAVIAGRAGVGKTALVRHLQSAVYAERGLEATGKFEQLQRDRPYAALADALRSLVQRLLAEPKKNLETFRAALTQAVEPHGQLLVDLVPEVEFILGPQPAVTPLSGAEAKARFQRTVRQLLSTVASENRPLMLFLDDLQWADIASIDLVQELVGAGDDLHILFVGAYRDNEVNAAHPLSRLLHTLETAPRPPIQLELQPLRAEDVDGLLRDTLKSGVETRTPLVELTMARTEGNPFYVIQFITELWDRGLLRNDRRQAEFIHDLEAMQQQLPTANVLEFLAARIAAHDERTQRVLTCASCIGPHFSVALLSQALELSATETARALRPMLSAGLLELHHTSAQRFEQLFALDHQATHDPVRSVALRFAHDRVEQSAYNMLAEEDRAKLHLVLGRVQLATFDENSAPGELFDIVAQFNSGAALLDSPTERLAVAELNLRAGRRAVTSTAYEAAAQYLRAGLALLPEGSITSHYALTRDLQLENARVQYLLTHFAEAHEALDRLLPDLQGTIDRAAAYRLRVELYTTEGRIEEAVRTGVEGARIFDLDLPLHPSDDEVTRAYRKMEDALGARSIPSLIDLPLMTDEATRAALELLAPTVTASIFFEPKLKYLTLCHMVRLSLAHGNTGASTYAYVYLGSAMGPVFGDYQRGFEFGRLAYDLVDRHGFHDYEAKVGLAFGNMVNFWTQPLEEDLPYLRQAFRSAREYGDLTYSCYCSNHIGMIRLAKADHLEAVNEELNALVAYVQAAKFDVIADILKSQRQVVRVLRGQTRHDVSFSDDHFDEVAFEKHLESSMSITVCWYYIHKLRARYVFGAYDDALAAAEKAAPLIWSSDKTHLEDVDFHFYRYLALAAQRRRMDDATGADADAKMDAILADFAQWAENSPTNFAHKHQILCGEQARLRGDETSALRSFERAASGAGSFVQDRALAHELAAICALDVSLTTTARAHLIEARRAYDAWGAHGKVAQLDRRYGEHLRDTARTSATRRPSNDVTVNDAPTHIERRHLDWLSVIRASQTLATETDLDTLLHKALELMVENAGAQRGVLLTVDEDENYVRRAEVESAVGATTGTDDAQGRSAIGVRESEADEAGVALSLIRYAHRTGEVVLLGDATVDPRFSSDPHVLATQPKSVMCIPMVHHSRVAGVVYLENNLATALFSEQRIPALQVLAAQAKISLDNARLLSDYRATEKALREQEHFIRRVLDTVPALVYTFDLASGAVAYISPNGAEWLGTTPEALIGDAQAAEQLLHPDDWAAMRGHLRRLRGASHDEVAELEYRVRTGEGLWAPVRGFDAVFTRDANGHPVQIVGVAIDLSSQRSMEEALRQAQKLEALGRLAGGVAHDFNNHLACISGTAELIPDLNTRDELEQYTREILQSVDHGALLIKQLLAFARKSPLQRTAFSVSDTVDDVARMLRRTLPQNLRIESTHHDGQLRVLGDPASIHTALLNLGINAGDAMSSGGTLAFDVRHRTVAPPVDPNTALAVPPGDYVEIEIRDTGTGMDEDVIAHIFEPFFTTKGLGDGTGLGLPAVRGTVEQHGGTISVTSEVGVGSVFTILLPRHDG